MKTNSSFHAAGEVATQPAWGTGEQAAQPLNGSTSRFAMSESRRRSRKSPAAGLWRLRCPMTVLKSW